MQRNLYLEFSKEENLKRLKNINIIQKTDFKETKIFRLIEIKGGILEFLKKFIS